jgi:hypothetical protein
MKKIIVTLVFLCVLAAGAFGQTPLPSRIDGGIPAADSPALYQIQVGAFRLERNIANTTNRLRGGGFNPIFENFNDLTRVIISQIPANEIVSNLERLALLGFDHVIIREDPRGFTISEKWNIPGDQGRFSSFEFTQENRFIAVERADNKAYFGEYNMPAQNIIIMSNLGTLRIDVVRDNNDIILSFSPVNEPSRVENFTAIKEAPMPRDIETDLFTRAWRITHRTGSGLSRDGTAITETVGRIYLYSTNGTYMVTRNDDSVAYISHWRWVDGSHEEFEYSHDNWQTYEKSKIDTLNQNSLIITEYYTTGAFIEFVPAYN